MYNVFSSFSVQCYFPRHAVAARGATRAAGRQSGGSDQSEHAVPAPKSGTEAGNVLEECQNVPCHRSDRICE